ncbi:hypothetical protein BN2476_2130006 [Paraburkholderia piptadeniae]|uniref:DDE domain-containing protein n=1 Tax=Paraburkholderia piptadeniae TaxID=1701573 RepID=A0A1N7SYY9_9BURK|nr:hypothetical protein BN2476_2130006 [Paraburkholderia piptadeniae]
MVVSAVCHTGARAHQQGVDGAMKSVEVRGPLRANNGSVALRRRDKIVAWAWKTNKMAKTRKAAREVSRRYKGAVGKSWRMDETYIKVGGQWKYLYRAVDKAGNTADFLLRAGRDKVAARRFFEQAIASRRSRAMADLRLLPFTSAARTGPRSKP